jgi:ribonuclease PH
VLRRGRRGRTGESGVFARGQLDALLDLGVAGCAALTAAQAEALA